MGIMGEKGDYDVEATNSHEKTPYVSDEGAIPGESFEIGDSLYAKLQRIAGKLHIEQRGIERVPENERTDTSLVNVGTMVGFLPKKKKKKKQCAQEDLMRKTDVALQWLSANMVVSSFAIGALATPVFGLGFVDTILTIFFINLLGIMPVCFFSTFGPKFGLRQMVLSRFFFGFYGVKISM
jgi:hypothetical protein